MKPTPFGITRNSDARQENTAVTYSSRLASTSEKGTSKGNLIFTYLVGLCYLAHHCMTEQRGHVIFSCQVFLYCFEPTEGIQMMGQNIKLFRSCFGLFP